MRPFSRCLLCGLLLLISWQLQAEPSIQTEPQHKVVILATGGAIAGAGSSSVGSSYTAAQVPVEHLLQAVPELKQLAHTRG